MSQKSNPQNDKCHLIFLESTILVFLILLLGEVVCGFYNSRNLENNQNLNTPESIILYVKNTANGKNYALALGDSVFGYSILENSGVSNPKKKSLASYLQKLWQKVDLEHPLISLPMDGGLLNDHIATINLLINQDLPPSMIIIQTNYRTFSRIHDTRSHLSRKWLKQFIPSEIFNQKIGLEENKKLWETQIDKFIKDKVLFKSDLYLLSRGRAREIVNNLFSEFWHDQAKETVQEPLQKDLLRLSIARYYNDDKNNFANGKSVHILESLLDSLKDKNIPILILYTPTNLAFLDGDINLPLYRRNRSYLENWFKKKYGNISNIRMIFLESNLKPNHFIDHTHMTEEGNRMVAETLFEQLGFLFTISKPSLS
jgi:hypothetical protein